MQETNLRGIFRVLNRYFMVPVFRLGLGSLIVNPFSGYIMVVKTTGHKTGRVRYVPVNYAILDGSVYCLAGFGAASHWYRNVQANPSVELLLPGRSIHGVAEEVTDTGERVRGLRQVLKNGGFAGFFTGFNPFTALDYVVLDQCRGLPLLRIRVDGVGSGPADPGGWLWLLGAGVSVVWLWRRFTGRRCCTCKPALEERSR